MKRKKVHGRPISYQGTPKEGDALAYRVGGAVSRDTKGAFSAVAKIHLCRRIAQNDRKLYFGASPTDFRLNETEKGARAADFIPGDTQRG